VDHGTSLPSARAGEHRPPHDCDLEVAKTGGAARFGFSAAFFGLGAVFFCAYAHFVSTDFGSVPHRFETIADGFTLPTHGFGTIANGFTLGTHGFAHRIANGFALHDATRFQALPEDVDLSAAAVAHRLCAVAHCFHAVTPRFGPGSSRLGLSVPIGTREYRDKQEERHQE
jgi:hypothetical protein